MGKIPDTIRIALWTHADSGLVVATSPDVPGLYVHGKDKEEIDSRIRPAVKALCEADRKLADEKAKAFKPPQGFQRAADYTVELAA
jgi:predicted RNase H-like HicB family nuclease